MNAMAATFLPTTFPPFRAFVLAQVYFAFPDIYIYTYTWPTAESSS
jgi:hypothetical protein